MLFCFGKNSIQVGLGLRIATIGTFLYSGLVSRKKEKSLPPADDGTRIGSSPRLQQTESVFSVMCEAHSGNRHWPLVLLGLLVAVGINAGCLLQLLVSTRTGHISTHHSTPCGLAQW